MKKVEECTFPKCEDKFVCKTCGTKLCKKITRLNELTCVIDAHYNHPRGNFCLACGIPSHE